MQPGDLVGGRFVIERLAGRGGMGEVYCASDRMSGERVALKVLLGSRAHAERFEREIQVVAELRHPATVRYVAHGLTADGTPYLAMEWLEGEDLDARLARGPLQVQDAVALGLRLADALGAAHARGIVHRDVKPSNIFIVRGEVARARMLDFGVARRLAARRATRTGLVIGTPGYMAPEQARGAHDVEAPADVFALGCVLYECLAGHPAFVSEHAIALLAKILTEEPPPLATLCPDVPAPLERLIMGMLAKEPARRPRHGSDVASALGALGELPAASAHVLPARLTTDEQRQVSVVLAARDERPGGSATAATIADEDAPLLPRLGEVARAHGGRLERLADGSTVAVLDSASPMEQAARAARLALALRALVPGTRIAVATGRGVVSAPWPVGEAIERAARMIDLARRSPDPPAILVDDMTAGLLDSRFDVTGGERRALLGERPDDESVRTLLGKPTRCVGRDRELGALEAIFDECVSEPRTRPVVVTGALGMGKSRLRHELLQRLRARCPEVEVWTAAGDPTTAGSPFGLLGQAIRRAAGLLDGDAPAVRQARLRQWVARHVEPSEVARITEFIGELVGTQASDDASVQLRAARREPGLMGDQMRRAFTDLMRAECDAAPLVLVLDDLHWGDRPSVGYVETALSQLGERPWFVLALGRPDVHELFPDIWAGCDAEHMRLGTLSRKASDRIVREALPAVGEEEASVISKRAEGNPFFLEELIRAHAAGQGGGLPGTVLAVVEARLDRLDPDARRVLRAASVFGQSFWAGSVAALVEQGQRGAWVADWLEVLVELELVARCPKRRFPAEEELAFRHALVRDAAYGTLTDADRALGHRLAAAWLEKAGETDEVVLADHFERGGMPEVAARHYLEAAWQARGGSDHVAVVERVRRGVACTSDASLRAALRALHAEALLWRGDNAEGEQRALEAMRDLRPGDEAWCIAATVIASASVRLGHPDHVEEVARHLRELGRAGDAYVPRVGTCARVVMAFLHSGRRELADDVLDLVDPAVVDPSAAAWLAMAQATRALYAGDPVEYLAKVEVAVQKHEDAGDVRQACIQRSNAGYGMLLVGLNRAAETKLREALVAATQLAVTPLIGHIRSNLGLALTRLGALDEARALQLEAIRTFDAQHDRRLESFARIYLSQALVLAGDLEAARRELVTVLERVGPPPPVRALALASLARVDVARGDAAAALDPAREAMRTLDAFGALDEGDATVRLALAEALAATGRADEAREAFAAARDRLLARADGMRDAALRESFLTSVPENARTLELAEGLE